jgi:hypothetical protein
MADITSRDFQELIKRQKETTDSLQTIIQQNDRGDDAGERLKDALPEIINDTRLAAQRESFDKKEGITETDNLQKETTDEVVKLQKIQTQGIDETKEQKEEQSELQQQIIEANKKGFLTFGERIKFFALGIKESVTKSNEDKKDEKRDRSKLLTSVQNLGKGILGAITSPIETTFKSIGAILKNLITGGLLLTALFALQKFINSDMWPKFLEGLKNTIRATIEITKAFFAYVEDLYTLFKEEGLGAVVSKLFTDTTEALGDFKKTFLIGIGIAVAAFAAAIYFAISTATKMVRGIGGMMGFGKGGKGAKGVKGGKSSGFDVSKMGQSKQTIKPDKVSKLGSVKNIAKGGARVAGTALRAAGPVGFAVGSVAVSAVDAVAAFGNANELFGKEANKFEKILAGGAGAVEGFTFGLIKAEDLIDTPGDKIERYAKQVEKSQLSFEKFEKFQQKRLEAGDITQEQFDKLIEQKRVATVESMKRNNEKIKKVMDKNNEIIEKSSIRQVDKINELVELMKDNKKLVAEKDNQTASFMMAGGNTNITTNPSEQTIVMDTKITDSFHSQVVRQQFG